MLQAYLRSHITWDKGFFKRDFLNSLAGNSAHPLLVEFIDFEAWYRKFTC